MNSGKKKENTTKLCCTNVQDFCFRKKNFNFSLTAQAMLEGQKHLNSQQTWTVCCSTHLPLNTNVEPVTQPSIHTCFHAYIQRGQSTTTTHRTATALPHTQKGWRTEICTVMPFFLSVMPDACKRHWEQRRGGRGQKELSYGTTVHLVL